MYVSMSRRSNACHGNLSKSFSTGRGGFVTILPFWLYLQYLAPTLNQAINSLNQAQSSMQQIQDAGAKITVPAGDLAGMWESLRAYLPNNGEQ